MLTLRCTLLRDTFEGALPDNPRAAEWPPSWMRLFSALVSVADEGADDSLLELLEQADPPAIHASDALWPAARTAYVPTNAAAPPAHTTLPGRTNSERVWARVAPRSRSIWFKWPLLILDEAGRERLEVLCRRVPYLGRSTGPAVIEVVEEQPEGTWLIPSEAASNPSVFNYAATVRCPFTGSLAALRAAFSAKYVEGGAGDPWAVGVAVEYGIDEATERPTETLSGPYKNLVVFELEGSRLDGRHTARVTFAVRQAILSRAERHIPTLHGHHVGDVVQCAVLGLPFVGSEHADGHLLGVGVAIPELPDEDLRIVAGALPKPGDEMDVAAGPLGLLRLRRLAPLDAGRGERGAWGLDPVRWAGPAREWRTCLPVVFDRFFKRDTDVEAEIRRAVRNSALPDPMTIFVSRTPLLPGALDLAPTDTIRRQTDQAFKPYRHVALRFAQPVRGPVVVGSMRHYGLGLCAPMKAW